MCNAYLILEYPNQMYVNLVYTHTQTYIRMDNKGLVKSNVCILINWDYIKLDKLLETTVG